MRGLKYYAFILRGSNDAVGSVTAFNENSAWRKFVRKYYGQSAMKPDRNWFRVEATEWRESMRNPKRRKGTMARRRRSRRGRKSCFRACPMRDRRGRFIKSGGGRKRRRGKKRYSRKGRRGRRSRK